MKWVLTDAQAAIIKAFLEGAAKNGWQLCPSDATDEMGKVSALVHKCRCGDRITMWGANVWRDMLDAAPVFNLKAPR